jgi:hypothetical protein
LIVYQWKKTVEVLTVLVTGQKICQLRRAATNGLCGRSIKMSFAPREVGSWVDN